MALIADRDINYFPHESSEKRLTLQEDSTDFQDMNLIEVLWKQDVDMGFTMSTYQDLGKPEECPAKVVLKHDAGTASSASEPLDEKLEELNPWEGLSYTIDLETGEYVLKNNLCVSELSVDEPPSSLLQETDYSLEDAFQLVSLNEENFQLPDSANIGDEVPTAVETASVEEASGRSSETSASFSLVSLDEDSFELPDSENISTELGDVVANSPDVSTLDADQQLDLLTDMIQTPQFHARPFQGRVPYMRTMSMEQRWQDLANLLSLPDPNHPYHHFHHPAGPFPTSSGNSHSAYPHSGDTSRNVLLHNATLAPPVGDLNSSSSYPNLGGASNIGSAVATSMNLTNSSEPMGSEHGGVSFKIENPHDMMYYQNGTSEMNHTTDGFLSSILNDEDLQLMDMAMNEGMYTMRMLEGAGNGTGSSIGGSSSGALSQGAIEKGTDSDSAVSSMGSERVPSLSSDTEWMETNSDSGHTPADHYADYHGKFRWHEYGSYTGRQHSMEGTPANGQHRMPSVAQKKHHMYGKRYFQEQGVGANGNNGVLQGSTTPSSVSAGKFEFPSSSESGGNTYASSTLDTSLTKSHPEMKYSCSVEFTRQHLQTGLRPPAEHVAHNHTYHLPPEHTGTLPRPVARDKQKGRRSEDEHMTRDEKRARSLSIPITVSDIINLPMDEFNERLSKYDLSESQLSLIRDIRRRGKNKVAAQNCRKRKLDQIMSLADEVKQMRDRKQRLLREREFLLTERQRIKNKFTQLYRHIFQALRDADGNPYSPYEWSLQQSADGSVLLVPRSNATSMLDSTETRPKHKDPDPRTQPRKP